MIERLPALEPDPARTQRTVARCRQQMARSRTKLAAAAKPARTRGAAIEQAVIAGLGFVYVSSVMMIALQVFSVRWQ